MAGPGWAGGAGLGASVCLCMSLCVVYESVCCV